MKKYLFILVFCPIISFAQAVDLDRFNFTVQFHSLPAMRLDSTYHTYNVVVESSRMMQPFMKPAVAENSVILEG
jgi:hypothetical protein